jgi:hypothetical protein
VELVTDSAGQHEYYINVGGWRNPDMQFVTLNFQGYNPLGTVTYGYSDGVNVGDSCERLRYFVTDGTRDLLYHKKYSTAPAAVNDPNKTRLVDGGTDYNQTSTWSAGVQWSAGSNPVVIFNMDSVKSAGGVRLLEAVGANQGQYADSVVVFTSPDSITFTRQGKMDAGDVWFPPVNYLVPARWDSKSNRGYKYWGILIHRFYLPFDSAVHCQYVKLQVYNSAPVSIVEAEVRDSLMTKRLVLNELNNGFTLPAPLSVEARQVALPGASAQVCLSVSPNPFSREINVNYYAGDTRPVRISVYDVQGRSLRTLFSGSDQQGWHHVLWNGRNAGNTLMPAGIYVLRLETAKKSWARTLVLVR